MDTSLVKLVFETGTKIQIIKSDKSFCNIDAATEQVREWKQNGFTIIFTAGVFDIFTLNHLLGLHHYKLLGGSKTKLIVSIDTDKRVKLSKAFIKINGGVAKPILTWDNRALMVAKQTMNDGDKLVNLILQHGSDTCNGRCPHDDNVSIAEILQPDIITVSSRSTETIEKLERSKSILKNNMLIIQEDELSYADELLGGKISNTAIIKRIRYGK